MIEDNPSDFNRRLRAAEQVDHGFTEMRGKLGAAAAGQQRVVELIESLIDRQDT